MKTTVEIPDPLAEEAKAVAQRDKTTLRALIETGLRQVLRERRRKARFQLRDASFRGNGFYSARETSDRRRRISSAPARELRHLSHAEATLLVMAAEGKRQFGKVIPGPRGNMP